MPRKGEKMSEEQKEKIRQAHLGKPKPKWSDEKKKEWSKKMSGEGNPMYGKKNPISKETVEKILESRKWYSHSKETRKKISKAHKGMKRPSVSPETRKKLSEAGKKRYSNPEERKKQSERMKKRFSDPAERKKISNSIKNSPNKDERIAKIKEWRKNNPDKLKEMYKKASRTHKKNLENSEYREKRYGEDFKKLMSLQAKEQWSDPSIRKKMIKGILKAWQNPDRVERISILMENQGSSKLYAKGWHESPKAGKVMYKSSWELYAYLMLDEDDSVLNYVAEPTAILYNYENRKHSYTVDLKIEFDNLEVLFVEIKPDYLLKEPKTKAKIKAAKKLLGDLFQVWTEKEIPGFDNCYWGLLSNGS